MSKNIKHQLPIWQPELPKDCPFCAAPCELHQATILDESEEYEIFFVECVECGAHNNLLEDSHRSKDIAIWHWNRRQNVDHLNEAGKKFDCVSCGACCAYFSENVYDEDDKLIGRGIWVSTDDVSRLPDNLVYTINGDSWLLKKNRPKNGHYECKSLRGTIGKKVKCSIYDRRPFTCRVFEPGSEKCLKVREAFGK